eukprot:2974600-Rhodomonas_salina.4
MASGGSAPGTGRGGRRGGRLRHRSSAATSAGSPIPPVSTTRCSTVRCALYHAMPPCTRCQNWGV